MQELLLSENGQITVFSGGSGEARDHAPPGPVKISHNKMAAKGGRIDIMFLAHPLDPLLVFMTCWNMYTYFCTAFVLRFKRFGLTHLNNISKSSAYYIQKANCMEASCLLVSNKIHQTYPFFVSRIVLNKVRQILKRIAHLRSPYRRITDKDIFRALQKISSPTWDNLYSHKPAQTSRGWNFREV